MIYITVDNLNVIDGVYDGSKDYVHRVSGEPIEGAVQVPEGSIYINEQQYEKLLQIEKSGYACWINSDVVEKAPETKLEKVNYISSKTVGSTIELEKIRLETLSESDLDAIIGGL